MSAPDESETVTPPVGDRQPTGGAIGQLGRRRGWVRGALDLVRSAALVILFFFLVRSLLVEAFKIPTSSMEFTLVAGDFLLVNKAAYGAEIPGLGLSLPALSEPDHGDVIVFHPPHKPDRHYVKRLVGLPGDTLQMRDKSLFVNGERISEPYVRYVDPDGDAVHPSMSWQATYLRDRGAVGRYRPSRDNGIIGVPSWCRPSASSCSATTATTRKILGTGASSCGKRSRDAHWWSTTTPSHRKRAGCRLSVRFDGTGSEG